MPDRPVTKCRPARKHAGSCLNLGIALTALCLALAGCQSGGRQFAAQDGDLLFQDLDDGPLCDAIETVTQGFEGARFSHVGMVAWGPEGCTVIQAGSRGVNIVPLKEFLSRSCDEHGRAKVVLGRLKPPYRNAIAPALAKARALVGTPYDGDFLLNNGKYYCSELVYECYLDPISREHLFAVQPMTFRPSGSDQPMEAWREYFAHKKMPIPEGEPGCNPGGISRSDKIEIIGAFGKPSGWSEATFRNFQGACIAGSR